MNELPYPWTEKQANPVVKKLQEALTLYSKVIELEPDNLSARIERAEIKWYPFVSDIDGCLDDLNFLLKQYPDEARLHGLTGGKWLYLNDYPKAVECYSMAIILSGSFLNCGLWFINLAEAYIGLEDYFKAMESYTNAIELLDATNFLPIDVFYFRGLCFKKIGLIKGAEIDYREFEKYKDDSLYVEFENYLEV
jgi:tetratricopeptide (TPR) repeat protein